MRPAPGIKTYGANLATSVDILGNDDWKSFNRYAYVQNDPVNFVDPLGLDPASGVLGALLGAINNIGPGTSTVTIYIGGTSTVPIDMGGPDLILAGDADPYTPQGGAQNTLPLPSDLEDRIANVVNNPNGDCADFIKRLIAQAEKINGKAFSDNPLALFNRVQDQAGVGRG